MVHRLFYLLRLVLSLSVASAPAIADEATRPLIAVVAQNHGTEPTDYLVPFAVLAGSGFVDVRALAVEPGNVQLHPADATLEVQDTIAGFDRDFPQGADYVIVPAVHDPKEPRLIAWLRAQHERGAVVMSVCDGAKVLAHAGLLDGRSATAHWYARDDLRREFTKAHWRDDRRYVFERDVATTSGVSASLPAALALLERIVGEEATRGYAQTLGVTAWPAEHDGASFRLSAAAMRTATMNTLAFWRHEDLALELSPGVDEAAAALIMDAYSRTYRSSVSVRSTDPGSIRTRHGLTLHSTGKTGGRLIDNALLEQPLAEVLDATLDRIEADYGASTAEFVALQLEFERAGARTSSKVLSTNED